MALTPRPRSQVTPRTVWTVLTWVLVALFLALAAQPPLLHP